MIVPGQSIENPVTVEVRPALAMEEMFAEVVALAAAGKLTRRGLPRNLLTLASIARRYDQEAHAPLLSVGVQRFLLAPLVWLGRKRHVDLVADEDADARAVLGAQREPELAAAL